ncbi:hypothetical protein GCM10010350_82380 [Streptomyces galilaeus]|nr:hypothetical protein GCM10010350_82380 [Streptomyces galilaeus]
MCPLLLMAIAAVAPRGATAAMEPLLLYRAVAAQGPSALAGQVGFLARLQFQSTADLRLERGEVGPVICTDDARVGCPAGPRVLDEVRDAPVGSEAVPPHPLNLGIQLREPRPPPAGQQQVTA